ncbi:hypothetical protein [Tropicibacter naphthalenivorans]|uniref:Uncharacterized protein n=1 Tax=Tropicibacter naphthalenivorans TaxID=441103 RepID=A0A0P1FZX8_9RHOB|nr:hypothetical protein [Tropicibacter naphthalenivorans]CUH74989.1 hypothetical protein TRN7648_00186 [Tropicibacter naphthalenivorans]SMC47587.1 hypothetical protein SAMN04488093_101692 [Tropicibacter naphthalenivorans]
MTDRVDAKDDEKIWIAFAGDLKCKPFRRSDVEYFHDQTSQDGLSESVVQELFDMGDEWEAEDFLALHQTLSICDEEQIVLPIWAKEALQDIIIKVVRGEKVIASGKGRGGSENARLKDDYRRYVRYDAVTRVRYYQILGACLFSFLQLPVGLKRLYDGKELPDLGKTLPEAIQHASVSLRGSFSQASEETIRKAYFAKDRGGWLPWFTYRAETLTALGSEVDEGKYLPKGYWMASLKEASNVISGYSDMPSQLSSGIIFPAPDELSLLHMNRCQDYENFADYIEFCANEKGAF